MTVKGSITGVLQGLPIRPDIVYQLIGQPIKNGTGKKIGEIVNVNIPNDEYIAVIFEDEEPIPEILTKRFNIPVSMTIKIN